MTQLIARGVASAGFDDEAEEPPVKPLTRDEAQALRVKSPQLSPWRVIAAQAVVGCLMALGAWWFSDQPGFVQSAIYGSIVAVLPGALMARGMTSRLSSLSVGSSAVSVMLWTVMKIGVSIAMLMLAPKLVQSLSWPVLLATLVLCMQVYLVALLWRGR
ncbi:MAG TPA: ATP synthase subunit I [Burkholderiaceae bacterium]|nr:ATP synthase subunit I [Burkholderiaceae bacterium]